MDALQYRDTADYQEMGGRVLRALHGENPRIYLGDWPQLVITSRALDALARADRKAAAS